MIISFGYVPPVNGVTCKSLVSSATLLSLSEFSSEMATVARTCVPKLEALSHIDISKLSQSELHALSLCSDSAYDLRRTKEVVIPQIDRSLFNESAGSRRQTYSRLRHQHHRSRVPGLHPSTSQLKPLSTSEPENHAILHFLKYFIHNPNSQSPPPPPPFVPPPPITQPVTSGIQEKTLLLMNEHDKKRKRGRKPKDNKKLKENGVRSEVEIVNKNGEVVDLNNLENNGDKLYSGELEKRTVGLQTEEDVLGFVRDLEGQWCSRRKRRKYVDASGFGDTLPIGWKLLLALRRRDGRVWVYCRRIVRLLTFSTYFCLLITCSFISFYALWLCGSLLFAFEIA